MMKDRQIRKKRKKIVRFPGGLHPNIGTVTFSFIAVYIAFNIYSYLTAVHISHYEVEQGTIEVNTSYTGLIIRKETVINASQSGRLDYYLKDNTKAGNGTLVCSIDENGNVSERLNEQTDSSAVLSEDNLSDIQNSIQDYLSTYQDGSFYSTYNFKSDLSGKLMEAMNLSALNAIADYTDYAKDNQTFHLYRAAEPGIVAYYTDGLENVTVDTIINDYFDQSKYPKSSLKTEGKVESGQPVYKLITDESWQIVVPIEESMKRELQDGEVVQIKFKEDNMTAWANYAMEQKNGQDYLILTLQNSMIRYAYERYIDINIMLDQQTGLKIPNSAITTKSFELVPKSYFTQGNGTSNQTGLLVERRKDDGNYTEAEFVNVTVYYEDEKEELSYISQSDIKPGDLIVMPGSTQRYEVEKTAKLKGVYNINKGYAVFRLIDEIYHNDNYTIVDPATKYGIMLYDHIALDGGAVIEGQMISL